MSGAVILVLVLWNAHRPLAHAQSQSRASTRASAAQPARPEPTTHYGNQNAVTDGAATALWIGAIVVGLSALNCAIADRSNCDDHTLSDVLGWSGVASYALGSPIIHLLHGHPDKAGLSFGLRLAALSPAFIKSKAAGPLLLGAVLTAMVIDDVWIAREKVEPPKQTVSVLPVFDPARRAAGLSITASL